MGQLVGHGEELGIELVQVLDQAVMLWQVRVAVVFPAVVFGYQVLLETNIL